MALLPEWLWRPNELDRCTDCSRTHGWILFARVPVGDGNHIWYKCRHCNVRWCWECGDSLETTSTAFIFKSTSCKLCGQKLSRETPNTSSTRPGTIRPAFASFDSTVLRAVSSVATTRTRLKPARRSRRTFPTTSLFPVPTSTATVSGPLLARASTLPELRSRRLKLCYVAFRSLGFSFGRATPIELAQRADFT